MDRSRCRPELSGSGGLSEDFSLLVTFLLVICLWLLRGSHLLGKTVFGPFSSFSFVVFPRFFRGPRLGQILHVLALEESSE